MQEVTAQKHFRHFQDPATVHDLIAQIKARHQRSYDELVEEIVAQLRSYFAHSFGTGAAPTRFRQAGSTQVRERFILGLSGGIDSAVVTYLAVRAVGRHAVLPVTMPARGDDESVRLAALVRADLGFDEPGAPYLIDLQPIVAAHVAVMNLAREPQVHLAGHGVAQTLEQQMRSGNFGSRVRIAVLSDLQRAIRGRILGTVNRSEYCQGYGTKFGTPISYDFGVLNELYKVDVYELGRVLNVPQEILLAPPTTGYFAGQTHEGELGATVEEQDIFTYLLFERNMTPAAIAAAYSANEDFARVMLQRFAVSEHKRVLNVQQERARISRTSLLL